MRFGLGDFCQEVLINNTILVTLYRTRHQERNKQLIIEMQITRSQLNVILLYYMCVCVCETRKYIEQ